ncbi:hypothetical protein CKF54_00470 [Psittacicella hinzii]|uniref:Uncharacterized protein n=1 Tax=Psittacicella hinzii TaxID=2028575 RepID=A0A3A1YE85_9GAMM|nr:autotransporter outer membrane beta-barrel domain-containing protein [Psittacicella hinzii]RIY34504.1 hypothetical protein CKF54_00470 [Psittacicella hinzii]
MATKTRTGMKVITGDKNNLYIQTGLQAAHNVKEVDFKNFEITLQANVSAEIKRGSVVKIDGTDSRLDDFWVIEKVAANTAKIKLADTKQREDWADLKPVDLVGDTQTLTGATLRVVKFALVKTAAEVTLPGSNRDTIDVTTILDKSPQTIPGPIKYEDASIVFFESRRTEEQVAVRKAFRSAEQLVFMVIVDKEFADYFVGAILGSEGKQIAAGGAEATKANYKITVNNADIELDLLATAGS